VVAVAVAVMVVSVHPSQYNLIFNSSLPLVGRSSGGGYGGGGGGGYGGEQPVDLMTKS